MTGRWQDALGAAASSLPASQPARTDGRSGKSIVILTRSKQPVIRQTGINRRILREMIEYSLAELTGRPSLRAALRELFSPRDIIGFKFDNAAEHLIGTNRAVCEELLRLFVNEGGFEPKQLVFIGARPAVKTVGEPAGRPVFGWTGEQDFGSGKDQFAAVLKRITALVNVPVLRADPIAGISGCLKNVTYGFMRHPARFFANQCTPYIADIYDLPIIRKKIRFHLVNSLKIIIRRDVLDASDAVVEHQSLLLSRDPVAADAMGYDIIERLRVQAKLKPLLTGQDFPPQLPLSAKKGLGKYLLDQIDLRRIWIS